PALDIGPPGAPLENVNVHLAQLMWFIHDRSAGFLTDLMATIERSDQFINPVSFAQDVALPVLVGRPLAIVRTVQSISTAGGVLPASQASNSAADALSQAVTGKWYDYGERQAHTCAGLDQVKIPVRIGDLTDIDDGLVAFLPQADGPSPYSIVYSAAAPASGANGVVRPLPDTVELTLNGPPRTCACQHRGAPDRSHADPARSVPARHAAARGHLQHPPGPGQSSRPAHSAAGHDRLHLVVGHARPGAGAGRPGALPRCPDLRLQPAARARGMARPDPESLLTRRRTDVSLTDVPIGLAVTSAETGDSILRIGVQTSLKIAIVNNSGAAIALADGAAASVFGVYLPSPAFFTLDQLRAMRV